MTYDEFWNGDNELPRAYRKAHEIRQLEADQQAWTQGAYVYYAISALAPALKAFAKGRAKPYLEQPFSHEMLSLDVGTPKVSREEKSDEKARNWMEMWAISFNERFEKNIKEKGGDADGRRDNTRN